MQEWEGIQLQKNGIQFSRSGCQLPDEEQKRTTPNEAGSVANALPVLEQKDQLMSLVASNQVVIVCGETGSGKSTQIPQFLALSGFINKARKLAVTQPRRLAASSLAARVAHEMNVPLGSKVGYSVRFDNRSSAKETVIKFVTDGMLLRECIADPLLSDYGALIIDEAHERTVDTDVILGLLRQILSRRPDFKLVISSATLDAKRLSAYFSMAPICIVPGRTFPVDVFYIKATSTERSYRDLVVSTVTQIHTQEPLDGDILVFLPGQSDIEIVEDLLIEQTRDWSASVPELIIVPVYATMAIDVQTRIFKPTPAGCRKVVLATNIAETSLTVPEVRYVVDTGLVKQSNYDSISGIDTLELVKCSRASANQRAGRAGRTRPGQCYRLYSETDFSKRLEHTKPEILRSNLSQVCLLLLTLGVNDPLAFPWLDSPSSDSIISALQLLYALGAVNQRAQLTKVGRALAEIPIDPKLARSLLQSIQLGCVEDLSTVAAMLGELGSLFLSPKGNKERALLAHAEFRDSAGDHFTLLTVYDRWASTDFSRFWCRDHFLQYRALQRAKKVRTNLLQLVERLKSISSLLRLPPISTNQSTHPLITALVSGYFMHLARVSGNNQDYIGYHLGSPTSIHPSSILWGVKPPPKLLIYHELVSTSKDYMRGCLVVDLETVRLAAPQSYFHKFTKSPSN